MNKKRKIVFSIAGFLRKSMPESTAMDTKNVYVNHLSRFDISQNSLPNYDAADEKQCKNLSQESDYVEMDVISSQNCKVKQEGTVLGITQNYTIPASYVLLSHIMQCYYCFAL